VDTSWLVDAALLVALVPAVVWDLRYREIPRRITFPTIAAGLVLAALLHPDAERWTEPGLRSSLLGGTVAFLIFGFFYLMKWMGRGDLRLMMGVGTLVGFPQIQGALLFVAMAGGFQGVFAALIQTPGGKSLARQFGWDTSAEDFGKTVPYGVAIALGTIVFRAWWHFG
jgi:prepilin peptidase CpaA